MTTPQPDTVGPITEDYVSPIFALQEALRVAPISEPVAWAVRDQSGKGADQ